MRSLAPVSVGIPTYKRGIRVLKTIQFIKLCEPQPAEIIIHVDDSDGSLAAELAKAFPDVRTITSERVLGPGGGRHKCIQIASQPYFVSFDDDSMPVDRNFFAEVCSLFDSQPEAAILAASVYHSNQAEPCCTEEITESGEYTGCGHAMRIAAYRETRGYVDRACSYQIEESDLALQLHALDWKIFHCRSLRVFHETTLSHHTNPDITAGIIQNVALRIFLRYPSALWPRGCLQIANSVFWMIKHGRIAGVARGIVGIPFVLCAHAADRRPLPADKVRSHLAKRARLKS